MSVATLRAAAALCAPELHAAERQAEAARVAAELRALINVAEQEGRGL